MQSLWSRAIQSSCRCRCTACAYRTSAVTRRVTTASAKTSWGFSGPSSTFYSTVFAAAALAGGQSKHIRKLQWDDTISSELEALEEAQDDIEGTSLSFGQPWDQSWLEGTHLDSVHQVAGIELGYDQDVIPPDPASLLEQVSYELSPEQAEDLMELLDFDSRMPGAPRLSWPINTGPDLLRWNLPPQSLWSTDSSRRRAIKQRHVWKKLAISELATAKLICYLVLKSNVHQLQEEFFDDLPESIQDIVRRSRPRVQRDLADISFHLESAYRMADDSPVHEIEQAEYIRRGFLVVPEYTQDDDGQFLFVAQQLNAAIRAAFSSDQLSSAPEQQSLAVAKICHNLLISSAPPDVQTYNLLILGFDRWNRPDLCREVITALDNAKVRPNELTCAAILNHYVNNNDPTGFSKFISRMRGVTNPLMLANPNIRITKAGQDRLIRTAAGKIKQKVYPTPLVFGALMRGALKFAGIERSMEIYLDMKEDGWGLDTQGISQLLEDCALRGAWVEGYLLWDEFRHLRSMGKIDRHMSKTYACMLGLCERTGKQVAYNQVLVEGVRAGLDRRRLASSAHAIALRAKALRGDEAPEEMDMNVGDSIFIALSDYGNDAREGGEEEKDSVTRRLGSWFRWGRNKRQEE